MVIHASCDTVVHKYLSMIGALLSMTNDYYWDIVVHD